MTAYFRQATFVTSDGAPLWFEARGDGPGVPAVFLDGLGCDGFIWRYLWEPVSKDRQVLHFNYRGHGKSGVPKDDTRIGIGFICEDLKALMDDVGMERAVLFGHSMGVQVALEFHRRFRERVAGLILICGSYGTPLDTWHDHSLMRLVFPHLKRLVEQTPELSRQITARLLKTELAVEFGIQAELNKALINRHDFWPYMEHLSKMHPLYFVRTLDSLKDHSAWDHLPWIDVPSVVLGGEIDRFTPVWLSQRMAEHMPGCEYVFVPGGSHTAPLERPGLFTAVVDRFLRERVTVPEQVTALP